MPYHTLSFGGGVNTVACLIRYGLKRDGGKYDKVVFADVGGEWPQTYHYIERYIKPYCMEDLVVVRSDRHDSLESYCLEGSIIPRRNERFCTDKFKVRPMHNYMKRTLHATKANPVHADVGFAYDESHRMTNSIKYAVQYETRHFPLIDDHITRVQCENIIREHGWPIPPKSGCWFCPFARKSEVRRLAFQHPDLYDRAVRLEENGEHFPRILLHSKPMRMYGVKGQDIMVWTEADHTADMEADESCESGHCFL